MEKQVIQYKGKYVCTFDELLLCYKELKNVWKVGEVFGISGQMVHKKLTIAGCINKMNIFTQKDLDYLKENYKNYRNKGKLKELSVELGRTKEFLSRKAKMLGLTDKDNHISMKFMSEEFSIRAKKYILEKGHPKGMSGKNHSKKFKVDASKRLKDLWNDPNSKFNSDEFRQKKSDYMAKFMQEQLKNNSVNNYNRVKRGMVTIGGKTFFARSSWECNIAAYLEFLKTRGEIKEWEHEVETFWFEKIKRGVRSYLPDFKITKNDNSVYFLEVKGWMDNKSKTKIKRMGLYYPNIILDVIDSKRYNAIKKNSGLIKDWGMIDSDSFLKQIKKCSIDSCEEKNFSKGYCRKHHYEHTKKPKKVDGF